jgi:hypothetical protein
VSWLDEILNDASRAIRAWPKWRRDLMEAERARDDEMLHCPWCLEDHPRRSRHWEWCAWRG